jgi:hypothetical protein
MCASVLRLRCGKRERILLRSMQEHESIWTLSLQSRRLQGENFLKSQLMRLTTSFLSGEAYSSVNSCMAPKSDDLPYIDYLKWFRPRIKSILRNSRH